METWPQLQNQELRLKVCVSLFKRNESSWIFIWLPHCSPTEDDTIILLSGCSVRLLCRRVYLLHLISGSAHRTCAKQLFHFSRDSCYWDSISGFFKCHEKKRRVLAYSSINSSVELINFLKTTSRVALIMKTTRYHVNALCWGLMKNTLKTT